MNYIIILDFSTNEVIKIKLTTEQKELFKHYEDTEEFLYDVFPDIDLSNTQYMCVDELKEQKIGF